MYLFHSQQRKDFSIYVHPIVSQLYQYTSGGRGFIPIKSFPM